MLPTGNIRDKADRYPARAVDAIDYRKQCCPKRCSVSQSSQKLWEESKLHEVSGSLRHRDNGLEDEGRLFSETQIT